ncbi:hypothetical protein [Kordia sp.]|uniref:hypothetical protein n=1 Tax=Kordia sp. TaxID=1965332 RepID=UPI003D6A55BF
MSQNVTTLNFLQVALVIMLLIAGFNIMKVSIEASNFSLEKSYDNRPTTKVYSTEYNQYAFIQQNLITERYTGAIIAYGFIAMSCIISIVWIQITKVKLQHDSLNLKKYI